MPRALLLLMCAFVGCESGSEWQIRKAVKRVLAGEKDHVAAADFVVSKGRLALPEIEQQLHSADSKARQRLIRVIQRIGDPEAITLLQIVARWADEEAVRADARHAIAVLREKQKIKLVKGKR